MSTKVRIWTLNQATTLVRGLEEENSEQERKKEIEALFAAEGIECLWGERLDSQPEYQLMYAPEDENISSDVDEYFVPIPLKCIGRKYQQYLEGQINIPDDGKPLMDGIINSDRHPYFRDKRLFEAFWDRELDTSSPKVEKIKVLDEAVCTAFGQVRMKTPNFMGYYELLEQYQGETHILIGYSQGGLVARYLAFLDEYVFQKNIISGVITIASPNYGSPLAHPGNRDSVIQGVVEILRVSLPIITGLFDFISQTDLDNLTYDYLYNNLIKRSYLSVTDRLQNIEENNGIQEQLLSRLKSFFETAIKWLSGLENNPMSAFDDLDIDNYHRPYSVLRLVNENPLKQTYSGAIITGNSSSMNLLLAGASWLVRILSIPLFWLKARRVNTVYSDQVMMEQPDTSDPTGISAGLVRHYQEGYPTETKASVIGPASPDFKLPAYRHDFVIPSVYQLLPGHEALSLGHFLNLDANHNTGRALDRKTGQDSWTYTKQLLARLAHKLH